MAGRHAATRRQLAQLLLAGRQRRGGQARHERVRLRRHRRVAPLALHVGSRPSSTTYGRPSSGRSTGCCRCRRRDGLVLWAIEADGTRRWDYALLTGTSSIQHALRCGVALADIVGEPHPEWERRGGPHGRCHRRSARCVRAEAALGDGLVLPGPDRRADRRGGQGPPRRGLGRVRHGGARHPLRQRRAVGHGVGDGGVRAGLRGDRRPRHGDGAAVVDEAAPPGRRLVLDRPRVRIRRSPRASASRSRSTRRTPPPRSSSPPTPSPVPLPPQRSSPRARSWTEHPELRFRSRSSWVRE